MTLILFSSEFLWKLFWNTGGHVNLSKFAEGKVEGLISDLYFTDMMEQQLVLSECG